MNLSFTVYGSPQPQGSTKAFIPKGWKRAIVTSDNKKLKPWRQDVAEIALDEMAGREPSQDAVVMRIVFYFAKPKSASKRIAEKITKPDLDKLLRGILDSLTGIAFKDDAQVIQVQCAKEFGTPERACIELRTLPVAAMKESA
jgi:crossover junction endodeoxyribonuclease RusA